MSTHSRFVLQPMIVGMLLLLLVSTATGQEQKDNLGKEFYVGFMRNTGGEPPTNESDNNLALYITSKVPTSGRVEIPALNFEWTFTTTPGSITTVALPDGNSGGPTVAVQQSEIVLKGMAVHITAKDEIAVFGINHKLYSSDAFMALPIDVLGTEYRAMSYVTSEPGQGAAMPGEFMIVGIEDSTNVTIIPKARTKFGRPANVPIEIMIHRGDVYMLQSETTAGLDLTGSLVESDRPIAFFSGHERSEMPEGARTVNGDYPSRDHLVEQLPPVSAWGDSAFVVPFATSEQPDLVRVLSAEDNNTVSVNGAPVATLNAGQFYEIRELQGVTQIGGTNPILVGQYMHTSWGETQNPGHPAYGDPALALVFPVEQFTTGYTILSIENAKAYKGNFVNIVVSEAGVASMKLDGNPIPATEFNRIGTSTWMYAQIRLQQGTHNLTGDKPFGITVYALGNVDSYAYTGGTLTKTITPLKSVDVVIDFGDRLLNLDLSGYFDTTVVLRNTSTEVVNVFAFPKRTQDTSKFQVVAPNTPYSIAPTDIDSMTIRFEPREINRRMHTQIIAKTDHLRAYVVDVYGRGVLDQPVSSADSLGKKSIDIVDFGFFTPLDPPMDSTVYIANLGFADMRVESMTITGPNAPDFSVQSIQINDDGQSVPFIVGKSPSSSVHLTLRYTPAGPDGYKEAWLTYRTRTGHERKIKLIANVFTVELATVTGADFDVTPLCKPGEQELIIKNPNTIPLRVDSVVMIGPHADDFQLFQTFPQEIGPKGELVIRVRFTPSDVGLRTAQAVVYLNLPKGMRRTASFAGVGAKIPLEYHMPRHIHVLTGQEFRFPIFVDTDLEPFQAKGYTIFLRYDPTHLEDIDVDIERTLSHDASIQIYGDAGDREIRVTMFNNEVLKGGGPEEVRPLLFVKFRSFLVEGDNPLEFQEDVPIHFNIRLKDKQVEDYCVAQKARLGVIALDSTCAEIWLTDGVDLPETPELQPNFPNPFNPTTDIIFGLEKEQPVRVEIVNPLGQIVRTLVDDVRPRGRYRVKFDASGLPSGTYTAQLVCNGVMQRLHRMVLTK